ncbi:MAG: alkaline phosphatase [Bacteroidetes bacterium]|jgi:membrane-associated protein|nr:alkaline phosphatase [Bacteroidota bacterium]
MDGIMDFLKELVNPESIIRYGGIYLLLFVVFAETGLFVGFFLPGDSLLFTAGLLCSTGVLQLHPVVLIILIIVAAVTGNMVGYSFGKKVGPLLFKRKSGFLFRQEHLVTANEFYKKHGKKTIILSRFLPIVRTFAPIVAGIVKLEYYKFFVYSLVGAFFWVCTLVLIGYYMGKYIPGTKEYLEYIVIFLIVITSIPFVYNWLKKKFKKNPVKGSL